MFDFIVYFIGAVIILAFVVVLSTASILIAFCIEIFKEYPISFLLCTAVVVLIVCNIVSAFRRYF